MSGADWGTMTAVIAVIGAVAGACRYWVLPFLRRIGDFLDDWNGEPERPGHEARPGVPARLAAIEVEQKRVRREVEHNGGGSLKDAVKRLEEARGLDREALDTLTRLVGAFIGREQTARIEGHRAQSELFETMRDMRTPEEGQ